MSRAAVLGLLAFAFVAACGRGAPTTQPAPRQPEQGTPAPTPTPTPAPVPAPSAPLPVFEIGMPPGEGIPVFTAQAERLTLLQRPYPSADVAAVIHVTPGTELTVSESRYQTVTPATVRALAATTIEGRSLGQLRVLTRDQYYSDQFARTTVPVQANATFEFLQHRAEGTCFVRVARQVIDVESCPTHDTDAFRVTGQPVTQLWIRVAEPGRPTGWLQVREGVVTISSRRF